MKERPEKREMDDESEKTKESNPNNIRILSVYSRSTAKDDGLMKPPPPPPPRPSPVFSLKGLKVTREGAAHATLTKMYNGSNALTKGQSVKGNLKRPSTHDDMEMRIKMAKINYNAANKKTNIPVVDLHAKCKKDVEVHLKEKQLMEKKYVEEIGRLKRLNQSCLEEIEKKKKENADLQAELDKLRAKGEEKDRTINNLKKSMTETRERLHQSEENVKKLKIALLTALAKNKTQESGTETKTEGSASSPPNSDAQDQLAFLKQQLRKQTTAMKELYLKYESQKMELSCRCPDCDNVW